MRGSVLGDNPIWIAARHGRWQLLSSHKVVLRSFAVLTRAVHRLVWHVRAGTATLTPTVAVPTNTPRRPIPQGCQRIPSPLGY
jgi:hypothetical protein